MKSSDSFSTSKAVRTCLFAGLLFLASVVWKPAFLSAGMAGPDSDERPVTVTLNWSADAAHAGSRVLLAVVLDIRPGFHINADRDQLGPAGDIRPFPTQVVVSAADDGLRIEAPRFPKAHAADVDFTRETIMSFSGRVPILLPVHVDGGVPPGQYRIQIRVAFQACDAKTCRFPQRLHLETSMRVVAAEKPVHPLHTDVFKALQQPGHTPDQPVRFDLFKWHFSVSTASGYGWLFILLVAALGGLLLNFTPCVLPLIPIKIISLSQAAANRRRCFALGLCMSLGIVFFWIVLGALIVTITGFTAISQLFNYPLFAILVGLLIAAMAAGMCGWFSVPLPAFVYRINPSQESLRGSFALGILAAVLSTPCTAPFMGAAAAWGASQQGATTLIVFAAIGGGMALPYAVLSAMPGLAGKIPHSGPVSQLVKQVMALFMLAAAAYFVATGTSALLAAPGMAPGRGYWWVVAGFCAAAGIWLAIRSWQLTSRNILRLGFGVLGLLLVLVSLYAARRFTATGAINWIYYTPRRLEKLLTRHQPVLLDFTAEWCLNCKALEQSVLHDARVAAALARYGVAAMKVDITGENPAGRARLNAVGKLTIPLLVIYDRSGKEVFKADFYSVDQVLHALRLAAQGAPGP